MKTIIISNKEDLRQQKPNPKSYYSASYVSGSVPEDIINYNSGLIDTWANIKVSLENLMGDDAVLGIDLIPVEDTVTFTKISEKVYRAASKGYYKDFNSIEDIYDFIVEKQVRDINTGEIIVKVHNKKVDKPEEMDDTYRLLGKSIDNNLNFLGTIPHSNSPRTGWKKLTFDKFMKENMDFLKDINSRAVKYTIANLEKAEAEGVLSQYKKFQKALGNAKTIKEETKFWYQMFLSPEMAKNNMHKFFQSNVRNNVSNFSDFLVGDEEDRDILDVIGYQSNSKVKGDFGKLSAEYDDPEIQAQLSDTQELFDNIFDLLDEKERMYLTAALVLGTNKSDTRSYSKGYDGVDLRVVMKNPPKYELDTIEARIEDLKKRKLVPKRGFSLTVMLYGNEDIDGVESKSGERLFPGKQRIPAVASSIQDKIQNLAGGDVLGFLGLSEAKDEDLYTTVQTIIKGGKISRKKLIHAIIVFVNLNKKWKTHVDTSGNLKSVASRYLKLSKKKSSDDQAEFYDLFLAPMVHDIMVKNPKHFLNDL